MGLFKSKNGRGFNGDGYYDTDPTVIPEGNDEAAATAAVRPASAMEMKVVCPKAFEDVSGIADCLLVGNTVFLNIENTPPEAVRRIIDFLSGVAYSIDGRIQKISTITYVITPQGVDVSEMISDSYAG